MFLDVIKNTDRSLAGNSTIPSKWNSLWDWDVWDRWSSKYINKYTNDDGNTVYEVEVPGYNKDNLEISMSDYVITIKGERKTASGAEVGITKHIALESLSFSGNIDAEVRDGMLYITVENKNQELKKIELK